MSHAQEHRATIVFGRFQVLPHRRELLADGHPVRLGDRAYDLLLTLIEARGAIVGRGDLQARVWPDRTVEDNALQVQISALRAALGPDRALVRTVSGRGYQFAGEIRVLDADPSERAGGRVTTAHPPAVMPPTNMPERVSELIGRDDALQEVLGFITEHRLVTLTGPGGIGKTRLALEAARCLLPEFADGVWVAELAPITDPGLVPAAVAAATGLEFTVGAVSPERVVAKLSGKRMLLVLDNCEHVIDDAAAMAEALLRPGQALRLIATSREPLKADGEWVCPVPPLGIPAEHAEDDDDPMHYGSVRLFIERARAGDPRFAPDRRQAATVADICRRLDGIPLALELAAARVAALGVEELAARLDDRFRLLTGGRRTALARHRTLRATLDWSFELLSEHERVILRRLSILAGSYSLKSASAIVAGAGLVGWQVVEGVANLVEKSLVSASAGDTGVSYRLLDTTRAYAFEKLDESGESRTIARRHAEYFRDLFDRPEADEEKLSMPERLAGYRRELSDVRVALDWAFSPAGDAALGVALTAASVRLWFGLSLMDECRRRIESALAILRADVSRDTRLEMRLSAAVAAALYYAKGPCQEACAAWTDVLAMAEALDDSEYRLRAFWGLFSHHAGSGELRTALRLAQRLAGLPADQAGPTGRFVGERMLGTTLYLLGDPGNARRHLDHVLRHYPASVTGSNPDSNRFEWDRRSAAHGSLVPVLWLQGLPDQAMRLAAAYVEEARATNHPVSLCWALYAACPIALAVGDLVTAQHFGTMLLEHSTRHAPGFLRALSHGLQGEILVRRGDAIGGIRCLHFALDELRASGFVLRRPAILGALAEGLAASGKAGESLAPIEEALAQCERYEELWNIAELLRLKGELLLLQGTDETRTAAESYFLQALDWARRQGALSWELRCATSLARLLKERRRVGEARGLLSAVYDRFTEGFETADLKTAKAMLGALTGAAE